MKKIFTLIAATLMAVGAQAEVTTITVDLTTQAKEGPSVTVTTEGITVVVDKGESTQNVGAQQSNNRGVRVYAGHTFTITMPNGKPATAVEFVSNSNGNSLDKFGPIKVSGNSDWSSMTSKAASYKWSNEDNTQNPLVFTLTSKTEDDYSANIYISALKISYGKADPTPATAATTWNFSEGLSATDLANITADNNWGTKTDSESNSYYTWTAETAITARNVYTELKANNVTLDITKGILFTRDNSAGLGSGAINFYDDHMNIANSKVLVKLESLAKNDKVRIKFYSNGNESRGFDPITNADKTSVMSTGKTDIVDAELTIAADGDLTLSTTKSVNILAITINTALPVITAIQNVKAAAAENGVMFNLAGQKVGNDFKGIVVKDGKKVVIK